MVSLSLALFATATLQDKGAKDAPAEYDGARDMLQTIAKALAAAEVIDDAKAWVTNIVLTANSLSKDGI